MKKASPIWVILLLLTLGACLSTHLEPQAVVWSRADRSQNALSMLFGDGRKLFANQFFTMADVYFHSGYYPSIFDKSDHKSEVVAASRGQKDDDDDEKSENFAGKPHDWIDAFGRNFKPITHTHLEHGNEREILPWLKLAADMDPQMLETYTVGAYWLREHLHETKEAEAFLREGLRNNPGSPELLFDMGRAYLESDHDTNQARNIWIAAAAKFQMLPENQRTNNDLLYDFIIVRLANLEEDSGNWAAALNWYEKAMEVAHNTNIIQVRINEMRAKMAGQSLNILTNSLFSP